MSTMPRWRLPLHHGGNPHPVQSAAYLAARKANGGLAARPKCQGKRRSDGQPCGQPALRGGKFCRCHGGLISAAKAEAEKYGRPVIIKRRPRQKSLGAFSVTTPLPDGMPRWMDRLGPMQRGRAIEAWGNRLTAEDVWKNELTMPRYRDPRKTKT